jgi:hypothetical protein
MDAVLNQVAYGLAKIAYDHTEMEPDWTLQIWVGYFRREMGLDVVKYGPLGLEVV